MSLTRQRAADLLACFPACRVAVVGDLMLDRYLYGTVERISPEAPVPVVRVNSEKRMPGGAGNVACNIRAMGGEAVVCGWAGADTEGRELLRVLRKEGVDVGGVRTLRSGRTVVKTRIVAERQQLVRVDWDEPPSPSAAEARMFRAALSGMVRSSNGLIIEDYGKGTLTQPVANAALKAAHAAGIPAGLDPKNDGLSFRGLGLATPNRREAFAAAGLEDPGPARDPRRDRALLRTGVRLLERWACAHVLITLGPWGMMLFCRGGPPTHVPTRAREVFDVSGAGDTVIATCLLAMAAGADVREAAELANYAAGIVVGKLGTATCTPDELLQAVSS